MEQLVHAWDVLATMTPPEYSRHPAVPGQQQRLPELAVPLHRVQPGQQERGDAVSRTRTAPTCWHRCEAAYDAPVALRRGPAPAGAPRHARCRPATSSATGRSPTLPAPEVEAAWLTVYRDPERYWDLYQLGEELTDLEDAFRLWRFRHVTTVERVIGFKRGTGGTSGVGYLRKMLDVVLFPEIWTLRTAL